MKRAGAPRIGCPFARTFRKATAAVAAQLPREAPFARLERSEGKKVPALRGGIWFDSPLAPLSLEYMKKRPMVVAGVSVALLAALAWMLRGPGDSNIRESRITKSFVRSADAASETVNESPHRGRRASAPASRLDSSLTRHDASKLVNFILPKIEGRDVTIHQALALLNEAYQDACYLSREKALDLKFSVIDDPGHTISFSLKGKSFTACLDYLAALAGLEAERSDEKFELVAIMESQNPLDSNLGKPSVDWNRFHEICGTEISGVKFSIEYMLRNAGIINASETHLSFSPSGEWLLRGSKADFHRIESAIALASGQPNQLKFTTRTVTTTEPLDLKTTNLSPDQSAALLQELASRAGTELATEPSVTARDGQNATIEIIREKIEGNQIAGWTGLRHEITGSFTGLKLVGSDKSEKRPETEEDSAWLSESQYAVYPGDTHVDLVSSKDGRHIYRLLTVTPIDATGRPLDRDGNLVETPQEPQAPAPTASQVPGKAGFVFSPFNNKIIDVGGVPPGTLVMDPTYPAEEKRMFRVP